MRTLSKTKSNQSKSSRSHQGSVKWLQNPMKKTLEKPIAEKDEACEWEEDIYGYECGNWTT